MRNIESRALASGEEQRAEHGLQVRNIKQSIGFRSGTESRAWAAGQEHKAEHGLQVRNKESRAWASGQEREI